MTVTRYYVTSDAMGSATAILDEDGNVLERRSYEAFGEMACMQPDGSPVEISPTGVDVGFQGQICDDVTGLYQMGYRWYNPALGRWLSRDPIGLEGGVNEVTFVGNTPTFHSDVSGLVIYVSSDYNPEERQKILSLLETIKATQRGGVILGSLEKSKRVFVLSKGKYTSDACHDRINEQYDIIYFDASAVIYIEILDGKGGAIKMVRASPERVLAHELGHAFGDKDDGPNRMNNVERNENPVARDLGQPARVTYPKYNQSPQGVPSK